MAENDWISSKVDFKTFVKGAEIFDEEGLIKTDVLPSNIDFADTFETISKNLRNYPFVVNYSGELVSSIVYNLGDELSITKSFNYTDGIITSIVLSGDVGSGIMPTKTFTYQDGNIIGISYS
jgi:hypothetical protein